mgnify:CR=1 FL=1
MVTILSKLHSDEFANFIPLQEVTLVDTANDHWAFRNVAFAYSKGLAIRLGKARFSDGYYRLNRITINCTHSVSQFLRKIK